jgi:hypothetical protein
MHFQGNVYLGSQDHEQLEIGVGFDIDHLYHRASSWAKVHDIANLSHPKAQVNTSTSFPRKVTSEHPLLPTRLLTDHRHINSESPYLQTDR